MPLSSAYQDALACLPADAQKAVADAFQQWLSASDPTFQQVQQNIAAETALAPADFVSLLQQFAAQLDDGLALTELQDAWRTACRRHQLKGKPIPSSACPVLLGRAKGLDDHAVAVAKASSGNLTKEQARKLLLKYAGLHNLDGFIVFLRETLLGNFLVWATFNPDDSGIDPFVRLPTTHPGICTALGLGHLATSETLVVLVWKHVDSGSPPLHRPTVADAEDYPYYRPCPNAGDVWGLTEPLAPNTDKLEPQPEVVMSATSSQGLQLPFRLVWA